MSCASALADQNSLLAEKPELLSKAEHDPFLKAELLNKHKMYAGAEKIITEVLEEEAKTHPNVATNYMVKKGEFTLSLAYLYYSRADCWYYLERFDKALADYTRSYQLEMDPVRLYDIGYSLYKEGFYKQAIEKFDEYLQKANYGREQEFLALYNRTFCVLETGDFDAGLRDLSVLEKKFPERHDSIQYVVDQVLGEKKKKESQSAP